MRQNNSFLPDNYETPKGKSNYMKLEQGDNRFRILSSPITGWLDWENKKPLRSKMSIKPEPIDPSKPVKFFWALIVFNYYANEVQILELTQKTIISAIEALSKDADWGNPFGYDIKINRSGESLDTEYKTNPVPHKDAASEVIEAFLAKPIWLPALYDGADPFVKGENKTNLIEA